MTEQLDLIDWIATHRHGETFSAVFDEERLNRQERIVYSAFKRGGWYTLRELAEETGQPEASISARFRDFKNMRGLTTAKRRRGDPKLGIWEYMVSP